MTHDVDALVEAAKLAVRWFDSFNHGRGLNGPSDAITVPRRLQAVIEQIERRPFTEEQFERAARK